MKDKVIKNGLNVAKAFLEDNRQIMSKQPKANFEIMRLTYGGKDSKDRGSGLSEPLPPVIKPFKRDT